MEIMDRGRAESATAGKCKCPRREWSSGGGATWTSRLEWGRRGDRINRTCARNYP